jgi:hypothetical protein
MLSQVLADLNNISPFAKYLKYLIISKITSSIHHYITANNKYSTGTRTKRYSLYYKI